MVYGAALERRFGSNPIEGSNPSPSARRKRLTLVVSRLLLVGKRDLNPEGRAPMNHAQMLASSMMNARSLKRTISSSPPRESPAEYPLWRVFCLMV